MQETLDLTRPVAISLIGILHFIIDDEAAHQIVSTLLEPLVPGSALMLSTVTTDTSPNAAKGFQALGGGVIETKPRTREEVVAFFQGLQLIEPGVVQVHRWRPDLPTLKAVPEDATDDDADGDDLPAVTDENVHAHGGVALKV